MFERKMYAELQEWKRVSNGKTAALIEGARRVGKSTVAEEFAKNAYADYMLLDFSEESPDVRQNFLDNIGDLDSFFRNLFLLEGKSLPQNDACLIFDEVQLFPKARQAIKQLVTDGRYHYIETGSLISIKKNTEGILIPSEEYKLKMNPMDFEEFLWATGDTITADAIRAAFESKKPLGDAVHRQIMKKLRTYMAVGGMPQAVDSFVRGETFEQIDFVKQTVLSLYENDLHKYDNEENGKVSAIFKTVPHQLGKRKASFKFASVEQNARYDRLSKSLSFLEESMIVNVSKNVTVPDALMELYVEKENFKMFMADTGLLVTQAMSTEKQVDDSLYKALIFNKLDSNLGMIVENLVAQMLVMRGHKLHFHEFNYQERGAERAGHYEIDFLLVRGKRVCPLEVKSSNYRTHKPLDMLKEKYDLKTNEQYVLYTKDLVRDDQITYLPLYMAMCL